VSTTDPHGISDTWGIPYFFEKGRTTLGAKSSTKDIVNDVEADFLKKNDVEAEKILEAYKTLNRIAVVCSAGTEEECKKYKYVLLEIKIKS
jgi:hypothetical protein